MNGPFRDFLRDGVDRGGFESDDVVAAVLPLFEQVAELHGQGKVADIDRLGGIVVVDGRLALADSEGQPPRRENGRIRELQAPHSRALEVVGRTDLTVDVALGEGEARSTAVAGAGDELTAPAYLPGYTTWEHAVGHHDELTDVLSLGLVLASLACGIDLAERDDVEVFARSRGDLFRLSPRLHPVIARVVREMTELDRSRRAQDISALIGRLESYRDQPVDLDLAHIAGLGEASAAGRRRLILAHLRDRLFEITRRNRLIYHKPSMSSLNLTVASVPVLLDVRNIKSNRLMTWQPELAGKITGGGKVDLGSYLRFEDAPYLPGVLDKLIATTRRDRAEYGFAQLRLVVCFLRWRNLKEAKDEPISSPLLLLPVELVKKRGVRDTYQLTATTSEAEVNPALRHHLKQLYDLSLPETFDLAELSVDDLHADLEAQIRRSEPAVTLRKIEQPRIELIRERARLRIEQFRRRQRTTEVAARRRRFDYSYARDELRPLGIQLFLAHVKQARAPFRELVDAEPPKRELEFFAASATEIERETYSIAESGDGGPYDWELDLCSLTLENFNYRKMTLVRDYNALLDDGLASEPFDEAFSPEPRPATETPPPLPLQEQYLIVPADTSQVAAIARARTGTSMIIQGPPGTGKSQTITNLIADHVARGKRVLFVCEKRAAIDVVFHRLRQEGLDRLCALIHDSQTDKRGFVHDLRDTYNAWGDDGVPQSGEVEQRRATELAAIESNLAELEHAREELRRLRPELATTLFSVVDRLVELRDRIRELPAVEQELLPPYADWHEHGTLVVRLAATLTATAGQPVLAQHPLRLVAMDGAADDRPVERLTEALRTARDTFRAIPAGLTGETLADLQAAVVVADARRERDTAFERAANWRSPLAADDARAALALAEKHEGHFLSFLSGEWRRARSTIRERYDFAAHAVEPSVADVLQALIHLQETEQVVAAVERGTQAHVLDLTASVAPVRDAVETLAEALGGVLTEHDRMPLGDLRSALDLMEPSVSSLRTIAPLVAELQQRAPRLARAVRLLELTPEELEAATARRALTDAMAADAIVDRYCSVLIDDRTAEAGAHLARWWRANADVVIERMRTRFREHLTISSLPAAQLKTEQKAFKKRYAAGRRVLEHEFNKQMRYKPIRDLATGESGDVVFDLKPIWLMSPLSVSDALPLDTSLFDLVIFDEASQIPIEEAVPALYRARQAIVVGDRMQLPPTQFFVSRRDDEELVGEEEGERIEVSLDGDSFLTQADARLPSTMLSWHYRSRSESLIAFSNNAFYAGELATVPDRLAVGDRHEEIRVRESRDAERFVDDLLERPISYHLLEAAPYESRRNRQEALYIAALVREMLLRHHGPTIGIVAFSEAQQTEIEDALEALAREDAAFADALEQETIREEDDQFAGLFVKNLENVQGDERDVILISVCYGPDAEGSMRMNFGPINQPGGERRLNVIFSRARHHMAVISSIRDEAITNTYNDGANTLRRFLRYAELSSRGDPGAATVLAELAAARRATRETAPTAGIVVEQLAEALRARGLEVETQLGRSSFRVDLAVRPPGADAYTLALLVDQEAPGDVVERQLMQTGVLTAFGWRVLHVATKDWLLEPEALINRIARAAN